MNNVQETDWDTDPVKMDKPIDCDRCQMMYKNLLLKLDRENQIEPAIFVSLLAGTKRCDEYTNLSEVRKAYASTMSEILPGSYERVVKCQDTEQDTRVAYRTMEDYEQWTTERLSKALNLRNKVWYHVFHKAERTFATIGLLGTIFAGGRFVYHRKHLIPDLRQVKWWTEKNRSQKN